MFGFKGNLKTWTAAAALMLAAAVVLAACGTLAPASKEYHGITLEGKSVLFVLDISGSMEGKDEGSLKDRAQAVATDKAAGKVGETVGGKIGAFFSGTMKKEATKLGKAKRELIPAVKGLDPNMSFSIVIFGGKIEAWQPQLVPATDSNKSAALVFLERLEASGGTPAKEAMQRALQFANVQTIFFLSDGRPNSGPEPVLKEVARLNPGARVVINTIGLGDDQDRDFLCKLAVDNKGVYVRNEVVECRPQKP